MMKIRVLVADNREIFREGLARVFEKTANIEVVSLCATIEETIQKTTELKPDLVLLNINITDCDCSEVKQRIKEKHPEIRLMIITPSSDKFTDPLSLLKLEADGYVDESVNALHLAEILASVHQGRLAMSPSLGTILLKELGLSDKRHKLIQQAGLSKREEEVLALVSKGLHNKQIANTLFIAENTVKVHLSNILRKLNVSNRREATILSTE